jgi:regulator of replication initiation timing
MSIQDEQELDLQLGEARTLISDLRKELYTFKQENAALKMTLIKIQSLTEERNIHNFSMEATDEGERGTL